MIRVVPEKCPLQRNGVGRNCSACKAFFPWSEFQGRNAKCRACVRAVNRQASSDYAKRNKDAKRNYVREYRERNREQVKAWGRKNDLKRYFGITLEEFDAMSEAQGHVCAICGGGPKGKSRLSVDHCHKTRRIRALLCGPCNSGIGQFQENNELLLKAINYLRRFS